EINKQIDRDYLPLILRHGIVRERFAALLTDSIRATLLEIHGYKVDMMEFVDLTDSPKNILIRATLAPHSASFVAERKKQLEETIQAMGIEPTLYVLLK
ncbi:MAG: SAM-dependent methyltransferase, partial [Clostridia bacterium]|nr:SAM-dependent methyltransferase [Clostridia bacterium]